MDTSSLEYAGFYPRLMAKVFDVLINLPFGLLGFWVAANYRAYPLYRLAWDFLFIIVYEIYLVRRFGGTPGKCIVGIRIRKLDGTPISYREAIPRCLPNATFEVLRSIALVCSVSKLTDSQYLALTFHNRIAGLPRLTPAWDAPLQIIAAFWFIGDLLVFFSNKERRALHDLIAGTVVVCTTYKPSQKAKLGEVKEIGSTGFDY